VSGNEALVGVDGCFGAGKLALYGREEGFTFGRFDGGIGGLLAEKSGAVIDLLVERQSGPAISSDVSLVGRLINDTVVLDKEDETAQQQKNGRWDDDNQYAADWIFVFIILLWCHGDIILILRIFGIKCIFSVKRPSCEI
jgi:hypothetical protein